MLTNRLTPVEFLRRNNSRYNDYYSELFLTALHFVRRSRVVAPIWITVERPQFGATKYFGRLRSQKEAGSQRRRQKPA
jgi:hypothetical protein